MIRAAALGLREAQRSGFTHRDVKPSNLMVDGHGVREGPRLRARRERRPSAVADGPVAQTTLAGTPLYMAPEQARGEADRLSRRHLRARRHALSPRRRASRRSRPSSVDALVTLHATAARPGAAARAVSPRTHDRARSMR